MEPRVGVPPWAQDFNPLAVLYRTVRCRIQHGLDQRVRGGILLSDLKGIHTTRRQRLHLISTPL